MIFNWFKSKNTEASLEARVSELESQRKRINLEWDETFEKFRLLYARLSKRVRQLDQAPSQTEDTQPGETTEENGTALRGLSPRQSEVQARILARRNRTGVQ